MTRAGARKADMRVSPERLRISGRGAGAGGGGDTRTSPSNSPPVPTGASGASNGVSSTGVSYLYGGMAPAATVPASNVAGVAGHGGGGLAAYLRGMGFGGMGGGIQNHSSYPLGQLALPPVSPASQTSSGRYVFGVSPASATSSAQGRLFSISSNNSGSELTYSPFDAHGDREVSAVVTHFLNIFFAP